jgi:hypothetical protein
MVHLNGADCGMGIGGSFPCVVDVVGLNKERRVPHTESTTRLQSGTALCPTVPTVLLWLDEVETEDAGPDLLLCF